jgi:uncharacterized metal-binding protein YceD (DUF177 family)
LEKEAIYQFSDIHPTELNLDTKKLGRFKGIDAKIKLHNIATGILANFEVNCVIDLTCVRCLESFKKEFNINIQLDYIEGRDPFMKIEKVELKSTDIDKVYYTGNHIDLSIGIREAIMLSLPIVPLCRDDCLGLCPVCGVNMNKKKCQCQIEKIGLFTRRSIDVRKVNIAKDKTKKKKKNLK